jgi:protein-S-isoprenylcysteine O-methyltransferase Ste14
MLVQKWVYRFRGYLVAPPLIFALFWFYWETEEYFVWPFGISLFLMGATLRIWAQQHLHYRLKAHKRLTVTGPYSFVRNPLYIGNILMSLGAIVISELLWLFPLTLFYCLGIYLLVVRYEESHLLDKYGESYRKYMEEVPRWLPKVIRFKNLGLINEYFQQSIVSEIQCVFLLLPYFLKELMGP